LESIKNTIKSDLEGFYWRSGLLAGNRKAFATDFGKCISMIAIDERI
jgi:hypothetical protein